MTLLNPFCIDCIDMNRPWLVGSLILILVVCALVPSRREAFAERSLQQIFDDLEYQRYQQATAQKRQFALDSVLLDDETSVYRYGSSGQGHGSNPYRWFESARTPEERARAQQRAEASLSRNPAQYRAWATFNQAYNPTFNKNMQLNDTDRELDKIIHSQSESGGSSQQGRGRQTWASMGSWSSSQRQQLQQQASGSRRTSWWNRGSSQQQQQQWSGNRRGSKSSQGTGGSQGAWASPYRSEYNMRMTDGDHILDSLIQTTQRADS